MQRHYRDKNIPVSAGASSGILRWPRKLDSGDELSLIMLVDKLRSAADFRMLLYAIVLIAMMLFNNSKFRMAMIEKRNLKKAMSIQKEGE